MRLVRIKRSLRIWGIPIVVYWCIVAAGIVIFQHVTKTEWASVDLAETILSYVLSGALLMIWWIIMKRFELLTREKVRKRTRKYFKFFLAFYIVCVCTTIILMVISTCLGS